MKRTVAMGRAAEKQTTKLSKPVRQMLYALISDIEAGGPVRGDWRITANWRMGGIIAT